jgi:hypothetical protein
LAPLEEFDVERDQIALLGDDPVVGGMPSDYVNDFLFVTPDTDVTGFLPAA